MKLFKATITLIVFIGTMGFTNPPADKFQVKIVQHGEEVEIVDNTVVLDKEEFQIWVTPPLVLASR